MEEYLTFDDVAMLPAYSNVGSRMVPDLMTNLTVNTEIMLPFVPSPMTSVIGVELGKVVADRGICPIYHRFYKDEQELETFINAMPIETFISWGVTDEKGLGRIIDKFPSIEGVVLDVAHAHTVEMEKMLGFLKREYSGLEVIAGAAATPIATHDLINWGADAVRINIGTGSACTTRLVTGFGPPGFTTLKKCAEIGSTLGVPIIADGGMRDSRDVALALAAGASCVMMGSLFARCEESPGAQAGSAGFAQYVGQASKEFQAIGRAPEGRDGWLRVSGSCGKLLDEMESALKSALAYAGAVDLAEFRRKVKFVRTTPSYMRESATRFDK